VQVGIHARLEHGDAAEFGELGRVGLIVERAGNQHVEAGVGSLARGGDEIGALDGAELRTDEDGGALLCFAFEVAALGADEIAGPRREGRERDPVLLSRNAFTCSGSRVMWPGLPSLTSRLVVDH
jgi:hypothetical protein